MILQPSQAVAELFTQAIFYGLYIPTFFNCLRWLLFEDEVWKLRPYKQMTWLYIIIAILVFALATTDIGIAVRLTRARLVGEQSIAERLSYLSVAIEGTTLIIIDAVLIYRCWTVYGKSWRVVCLPLAFWASTITCAVAWMICNAVGLQLINSPTAMAIVVGVFYTCNFATNVYATSAIVYRLWKTAMTDNKYSRLYQVCRTISGTGILYSFTSFLSLLTTFWAIRDTFPLALANSINIPTACIAYNFVIIRVGQLRVRPRTTTTNLHVYHSSCPPTHAATEGIDSSTLPLK
ncbi:hypothetical protein JOM56_000855 [Amanita muscaria]